MFWKLFVVFVMGNEKQSLNEKETGSKRWSKSTSDAEVCVEQEGHLHCTVRDVKEEGRGNKSKIQNKNKNKKQKLITKKTRVEKERRMSMTQEAMSHWERQNEVRSTTKTRGKKLITI